METKILETTFKTEGATDTLKYCLYARKSSEDEEKQALSIDSQVKEMLTLATQNNLNVLDIYPESHSAKECGKRPVYNQLLEDIRSDKFNAVLVWHPDRLSRNAGDLGALVDLLDQKKLVEIRTFSQKFTNNPSEKFLLMILGSQAKLENDNKSVNVKRGMRTRVEMGLWPTTAPTGYLNEKHSDRKCQVKIDPIRAPIIKQVFEKCGKYGWSGRKIYYWLKHDLNFKSNRGKHLSLSNIFTILQNPFYYGVLEYPKRSGKLYEGKHRPIITQELFLAAKEQLKRDNINRQRKEFAFTRLMICGLCGSGVTGEEKFKQLANGTVTRYVYYGCTDGKRTGCRNPYIREDKLVESLIRIIDNIDMNELGIKNKFQEEISRYNHFRKMVLKIGDKPLDQDEVDIRAYAKYVLREGNMEERRELLALLKGRVKVQEKRVEIID